MKEWIKYQQVADKLFSVERRQILDGELGPWYLTGFVFSHGPHAQAEMEKFIETAGGRFEFRVTEYTRNGK